MITYKKYLKYVALLFIFVLISYLIWKFPALPPKLKINFFLHTRCQSASVTDSSKYNIGVANQMSGHPGHPSGSATGWSWGGGGSALQIANANKTEGLKCWGANSLAAEVTTITSTITCICMHKIILWQNFVLDWSTVWSTYLCKLYSL